MDKKRRARERAEKIEKRIQNEKKAQRDQFITRTVAWSIVPVACCVLLALYYSSRPDPYPVTEQTEAVLRLTMDDIGTGPGKWHIETGSEAGRYGYSKAPSSEPMAATVAAQMNTLGAGEYAIVHDDGGMWQIASRWDLLDAATAMTSAIDANAVSKQPAK